MLDMLCSSGLFVHTSRAKEAAARPSMRANRAEGTTKAPSLAPRVALDILMLPLNIVLGTHPCDLHDSSTKLSEALVGPRDAAKLGALGLVNRTVTHSVKYVGQGAGLIAGLATTPLALLLQKDAGDWVGHAGSFGVTAGSAVGLLVGGISEFVRAAARWCLTHPLEVIFMVLLCALYIAAIAAVESGLVHAGVPQSMANVMAQLLMLSLNDALLDVGPRRRAAAY